MRRTAAGLAAAMIAGAAHAQAAGPASGPATPFTYELRDTLDAWRNLSGGLRVGNTTLDKLQAAVAFDGAAVGRPGFRAYAQVFRTNAESLSLARLGDTQTASNIEAPKVTRLFELWAEQSYGRAGAAGWWRVRAGLIDLNRTFDSIDPAGLFLNSSHGIGPDLSHSGVSGPSIFPASGLAAQVGWRPTARLAAHLGVFAEPDPDRLGQFADLRIDARRGAIVIAQADWSFGEGAQASLGAWRYTARQPAVDAPGRQVAPRPGAYAFVEGPLGWAGAPQGWIRAGFADGRAQDVSAYVGGGLVWTAPLGRTDDRIGLAVAHAVIGAPARRAFGVPAAETTLEASYSLRVGRFLHLQPDLQHIFRPAGVPGARDATAIALRVTAFASTAGPDAD